MDFSSKEFSSSGVLEDVPAEDEGIQGGEYGDDMFSDSDADSYIDADSEEEI